MTGLATFIPTFFVGINCRIKTWLFRFCLFGTGHALQAVPSYRRDGPPMAHPALKGGVTANIAFQASYALRAVARSARHERGRHLTPLCVPLRALEWGYDCFALRAMSLRDDVSPFGQTKPPAVADKTSMHFCPVPMAEAVGRRQLPS